MAQSVDFRIHDFINDYLDYKGFRQTVDIFSKERDQRQEPVRSMSNGSLIGKEMHPSPHIQVDLSQCPSQ
jgi:hypothetical protein